jgi:hypothetical protein
MPSADRKMKQTILVFALCRLVSRAGGPAAGPIGATFAIYNEPEGGTPLWTEEQNVELDAAGNYSVLLGSTKNEGVPAELFGANDLRWLAGEIQCAGCGGRPARTAGKRALCIEGSGCRHAGRQTGLSYMKLGTVSSSRRYKEDIQDMADASSGLLRLRPVTFRYKKPYSDGSKPIQYGLIAEEVAEVYPDLVARSADGQTPAVLMSHLVSHHQRTEVSQTSSPVLFHRQVERYRIAGHGPQLLHAVRSSRHPFSEFFFQCSRYLQVLVQMLDERNGAVDHQQEAAYDFHLHDAITAARRSQVARQLGAR